MRLVKHAHACVELEGEGELILIDPGVLAPDAGELLARASVVLVTHEHPDHVDREAVEAALAAHPDLAVRGPADALGGWRERFPGRAIAVAPGDSFTVGALAVSVHGGRHAEVHPDLPRPANVGYLVGGAVFHPGDSYDPPEVAVGTLLLPVSGPWTRLRETVAFARAVAPGRLIAIHEGAASAFGLGLVASHFRPGGLVDTPLEVLAPGEVAVL